MRPLNSVVWAAFGWPSMAASLTSGPIPWSFTDNGNETGTITPPNTFPSYTVTFTDNTDGTGSFSYTEA